MNFRFFPLVILVLFSNSLSAQKKKAKKPEFDMVGFSKIAETAEWLFEYDAIAWWTTDSLMEKSPELLKKLGQQWFCYQDTFKTWHAVYGNFSGNTYDLIAHYIVDSAYNVYSSKQAVDTSILHPYSRAIDFAHADIDSIKRKYSIRLNQFVRKNADETIDVWIFPAFQPNSTAVYGGEWHYVFNKYGTTLLWKDNYFKGFYGYKVKDPIDITINYNELDEPTLGGVFFVWYYKKYFSKIVLETRKSNNTVLQNDLGQYYWVNSLKD